MESMLDFHPLASDHRRRFEEDGYLIVRGALGPDHAVWPETAAFAGADAAEDSRGGIDEGGLFQHDLGAEYECHGPISRSCPRA